MLTVTLVYNFVVEYSETPSVAFLIGSSKSY